MALKQVKKSGMLTDGEGQPTGDSSVHSCDLPHSFVRGGMEKAGRGGKAKDQGQEPAASWKGKRSCCCVD